MSSESMLSQKTNKREKWKVENLFLIYYFLPYNRVLVAAQFTTVTWRFQAEIRDFAEAGIFQGDRG